MKKHLSLTGLIALLPLLASAGPTLNLDAKASTKVPNDEMIVTVGAVQSGQNVAKLNEAVLSTLNDAIKDAKAVPGVMPQMGSIYTTQDWRDGKPSGWQVNGEIILRSQDMPALANLAGKLGQKLQLRGVVFGLSEPKRRDAETRLLKEAAAAFRDKAEAAMRAFGYQKYAIEELAINDELQAPPPRPMALNSAMARAEAAPMPAEGGAADVQMIVRGRVKLD